MRRRLELVEAFTEVNGLVVVGTPKTHAQRSVGLPGFLAERLKSIVAGMEPDGLVFTGPGGGALRNSNFRRRIWLPSVAAAGLDGLTPHDLRHTAASLAISAGASVKAFQRMLRHASAAMTLDLYAGLFADELDDVAERLDARHLRWPAHRSTHHPGQVGLSTKAER